MRCPIMGHFADAIIPPWNVRAAIIERSRYRNCCATSVVSPDHNPTFHVSVLIRKAGRFLRLKMIRRGIRRLNGPTPKAGQFKTVVQQVG